MAAGVAAATAVTGCADSAGDQPAVGGPGGAGATLPGTASSVPVGGGVVFAEQQVIVTQPKAGVFHAFSAVCTHQGCTVAGVVDGAISCPCHGSRFDVGTGSVLQGPAEKALPRRELTVEGTALRLG